MSDRPEESKGIDHNRLPVGRVIAGATPGVPIRGKHLAMPLFGWVGVRDKTNTPLVMLTVLLMKTDEETGAVTGVSGSMSLELPVFPETEVAVAAALERFGWDNRVWPIDDGWPTGSEDDEAQILDLMEKAELRATMTFPPGVDGVATQEVDVQRANGPFLMPPLADAPEGAEPKTLARLRELCENPKIFFRPQKPAIFS